MKYKITWTEEHHYSDIVEADSAEEARNMVLYNAAYDWPDAEEFMLQDSVEAEEIHE